jgi:type IV secretion system protein VirB9
MKKVFLAFLIAFHFFGSQIAFATREARPLPTDQRLRVLVYNPNDVFKYTGFYGYESSIVFAPDETISSLTMGDSVAWQMIPNANRLFIKPIENDATTNMTVITNKRVYHFELHASFAENINDPNMVFSVKFLYPEDENGAELASSDNSLDEPDADDSSRNYDYTISGDEAIAPIKIFDDGVHTYIEYDKHTQELPAFYVVYPDNTEGIVNFSVKGKYIVIHRIASKFTIRRGTEVGCIFNENLLNHENKS